MPDGTDAETICCQKLLEKAMMQLAAASSATEPERKWIGMHTLYLTYEEKLLDMMIAYSKVETSLRFSLTHGGRYLPFDEVERQALLEQRAFALARLEIDRIMRSQARLDKTAG